MALVAVFGVAPLVAILLSGLAARTVLSTSFLFLLGGSLVRSGFLSLVHITPDSEAVSATVDLQRRPRPRGGPPPAGRDPSRPRRSPGPWTPAVLSARGRQPSHTHSPLVAVVEHDSDRTVMVGAVTAAHLMERLIGES
ncbi:hypothetical protein ABZS88_39360 [Streptomyces sp. NPDC005480]|uniref:hypothetical protein n=1 Tax=Streptomyces sp. NPDC005480 TaxID=3154880 RepID=UPI0033A9C6C8